MASLVTYCTAPAALLMSSNSQPLSNSEKAGRIVELLVIHHWLFELDLELASAPKALAVAWAPSSRALQVAALRVYLEVERDYTDQFRFVSEDTSLFDELVAEFPENFGYD